jgi:hypothetical protein
VTAVAFMALVVACTALLCGHQGQPFPLHGAWRYLTAPRRVFRASRVTTGAYNPAGGRLRPRPLWAHSQPLDYEETA